MKYFLFAPTISYWQWLVMSAAVLVAALMGFSPWSALAWLGIVIFGGAIEAVFGGLQQSKKTPESIDPEGLRGGHQ
ncbi:hypothetical protein ACW582_16200 [Pseudomonas chlororaphis]